MHDGWEYVAFDYGVVVLTLGVWFAMIGRKLRRQRQAQQQERARG